MRGDVRLVPERRGEYRAFSATVAAVADLTSRMRRVTLSAPQFADYRRIRADDFFALLLPGLEKTAVLAEELTGPSTRGVAALVPGLNRPTLRWYTIRAHRPDSTEIDVDIVLHGSGPDSGPGSRWAASAQPGDEVGFAEGNGMYNPHETAKRQLFFADITALPALSAILEDPDPAPGAPRPGIGSVAHIEVPDAEDITHINTEATLHWHVRDDSERGFSIPRLLDSAVREVEYAWLCAERDMVARARRSLVDDGGLAKESITFSGFWRFGEERV